MWLIYQIVYIRKSKGAAKWYSWIIIKNILWKPDFLKKQVLNIQIEKMLEHLLSTINSNILSTNYYEWIRMLFGRKHQQTIHFKYTILKTKTKTMKKKKQKFLSLHLKRQWQYSKWFVTDFDFQIMCQYMRAACVWWLRVLVIQIHTSFVSTTMQMTYAK